MSHEQRILLIGSQNDQAMADVLTAKIRAAKLNLFACQLEQPYPPNFIDTTANDWVWVTTPGFPDFTGTPAHPRQNTFDVSTLQEAKLCLVPCEQELLSEIAARCDSPEKIIGYSALGLLTGQSAIELCVTPHTSPSVLDEAKRLIESIGLKPILVPETPGLILGRTIAMLVNEAASALMEHVASPADIDTAMTLGTNYPRGPLVWGDLIGLDLILGILDHLEATYHDPRYRAMPLLRQKVLQGELGVKSGQGFYGYSLS